MEILNIIEQVKKEYYEINWFTDLTVEKDGRYEIKVNFDLKLLQRSYDWYSEPNLLICHFQNSDSRLANYIMIGELKTKPESSDSFILLNLENLDELQEEPDYFKHNQDCFKLHFIKLPQKKDRVLNHVNRIVAFKNFDDFIKKVYISEDNWNDYGYCQIFSIKVWFEEFKLHSNPRSEEMIKYMKTGKEKPNIKNLCTLGNRGYYEFLKKYLPYNVRKEWFERVNDLSFNLEELSRISKYYEERPDSEGKSLNIRPPKGNFNSFFYNSFLRTTTLKEIRDVFHPLTIFGKPDSTHSDDVRLKNSVDDNVSEIKYLFEDNGASKGQITFKKDRTSYLPMNVYGIVGGNGSGKSYKIEEIIKKHIKNDNNFSQLIHFSLSPFDNVIEVDNIKLTDVHKDQEGSIIYEKVGFVSVNPPLIETVINKLELLNLEEIKNSFVEKYKNNEEKKLLDDSNKLLNNKIHEINIGDSFRWYIQSLLLDLVASEEKLELWGKALCYFSFEPWAQEIRAAFCDRTIELSDFEKISKLSSGQATILLYLTKLVFCVNQGSLVIFDEPETFMHPPMIKSFIRAISEIVNKVGAFCLVATHSPVIIQEIPHCNVLVINSKHEIKEIHYKTYGQNLDALYKNIYGVELQYTGYNSLLIERAKDSDRKNNPLLFKTDIPYLGDEAYLKYLLLKDEIMEYELEEDD